VLRAVFQATEVGHVWGVGRRMTARLGEGGIRTVLDLVDADAATLRRQFSVVLEKTVLELRGTPCMDVDHEPAAQQQMMCSRSFGSPVTELPGLVEVVSQFASRVAEKARQQQPRPVRCMCSSPPAPSAATTGSTARAPPCRWCGPVPTPG
jgi:DNA polymerase V